MMKNKLILILIFALLLSGCSVEFVFEDPAPSHSTVPAGDTLTVHFIDVGQADSALLECDGEFMLIDGGNVDDSSLVVSYLESCGVEELTAVICTHAHEDHVGGLDGVMAVFPTKVVYAPTRTYSSACFDKFVYYVDQQGLDITIPNPGDSFLLGSTAVTILGPVTSYAETNDTSIVAMVEFGDTRFLFTGDMEVPAENDMLDYWGEDFDWNVDVLKAGHHGSSTSTGYRFLYQTDPEYTIISCGKDNSYGHPHDEIVSRFQDAGVPMFRTDELGTVIAVSDGSEISITWENQNAQPEDVTASERTESYFIGNKNSLTLHAPDCGSLPSEKNQVIFESYEEAIKAGYAPCSGCLG